MALFWYRVLIRFNKLVRIADKVSEVDISAPVGCLLGFVELFVSAELQNWRWRTSFFAFDVRQNSSGLVLL